MNEHLERPPAYRPDDTAMVDMQAAVDVRGGHQKVVMAEPAATLSHRTFSPDVVGVIERQPMFVTRPTDPPVVLQLPVDSWTFVPPYDVEWATGAGELGAKYNGQARVAVAEGFSAAGVAVRVTSAQDVLVLVNPDAQYSWHVKALQANDDFASTGGLGTTVYSDGVDEPLLDQRTTLWSLGPGIEQQDHTGQGGYTEAVAAPDGPEAAFSFTMKAGVWYTAWAWAWQTVSGTPDGFLTSGVDLTFERWRVETYPAAGE